jgi:ApbE superfamily uncharacterized protein (UPF0280 family)
VIRKEIVCQFLETSMQGDGMEREGPGREDRRVVQIDAQTVLVEYGPMRMTLQALLRGRPLIDLALEGGAVAFRVLDDLARFLPMIRRKAHQVKLEEHFPAVVQRMIEAARRMGAPDLTPLAAVAGATSDVVADFLAGRGATKIICDNGGDIALRLQEGEEARVGVKTEIDARNPSYLLRIGAGVNIGGVTTSGLGGRSFTKGIASAVTVVAENAALADAAATVIGNATLVEDPAITRCLPETIYPDTDIPGEYVTTEVGEISLQKIEEALQKGLREALRIECEGHIRGAFIAVKGRTVWTESMNAWLSRL